MNYKETPEYKAGYDCGFNSPNTKNSNFKFFSTKEKTERWEKGKREGELWRAVKAYAGDIGFNILLIGSQRVTREPGEKYKFTFSFDFTGSQIK